MTDRPSLLTMPDPSPAAVLTARLAAGDSQAEAALRVGLSHAMRWSEYERGTRTPDVARWALYLLATDQHPTTKATPRRRGKAARNSPLSTVEKRG